jgi:hypothetical protein
MWEARDTNSIIGYIITTIRETTELTGSEIESNHFVLQSTFKINKPYHHSTQRRTNKKKTLKTFTRRRRHPNSIRKETERKAQTNIDV